MLKGVATFLYFAISIWSWHFCFIKQLLVDSFGLRLYYFGLRNYHVIQNMHLFLWNQYSKKIVLKHTYFVYNFKTSIFIKDARKESSITSFYLCITYILPLGFIILNKSFQNRMAVVSAFIFSCSRNMSDWQYVC